MRCSNDIEAEVDSIRDKIYEKTKELTPSERTDFINSRAEEVMKQYGLYDDGKRLIEKIPSTPDKYKSAV
jgi:hypothetical protein